MKQVTIVGNDIHALCQRSVRISPVLMAIR